MRWIRGRNPYRLNHFAILQIGPHVERLAIVHSRGEIAKKINRGKAHVVDGVEVTVAEVQTAEARLLHPETWAQEVLLVHPMPSAESRRLPEISQAIIAATVPAETPPQLRLGNLTALAPLIPEVSCDRLPWPQWDDLEIPGPTSAADLADDVQFDL